MNFQANTKEELLIQLDIIFKLFLDIIQKYNVDQLNQQWDGKWSIFQNIDHLNKSNQLTTLGYKTPKIILRALYGKSDGPSRTTQEIINLYQSFLGKGAKSPRLLGGKNAHLKDKEKLLEAYKSKIQALRNAVQEWTEKDLDFYCMKHPIIGNITAKEMLSFTVYHQFHHLNTIERMIEKLR